MEIDFTPPPFNPHNDPTHARIAGQKAYLHDIKIEDNPCTSYICMALWDEGWNSAHDTEEGKDFA